MGLGLILVFVFMFGVFVFFVMRARGIQIWIWSYVRGTPLRVRKGRNGSSVRHVMFCVADHFEPKWKNPGRKIEIERIKRWIEEYPRLVEKHRDGNGRTPRHTFFYPEEEYESEYLEMLSGLCSRGFGEVEIHLHHDQDTGDKLREKLVRFKGLLHQNHGILPVNKKTGSVEYAFIHGNWALDNSRPDGRWCGVNNELQILRETGCYADFTLPSAPSHTQTKKINSIYYATDDPNQPKSHDSGLDVREGGVPSGDLLMIQGPLTLNWTNRKWGVMPRIENGEISYDNLPSPDRVRLWISQNIHVIGRSNWIFIKVHTHGAQERNADVLLGKPMNDLFSCLEANYNDGEKFQLHYVTAREMYNMIRAVEDRKSGNPDEFRNYVLNLS